jgi:hypothetical protein
LWDIEPGRLSRSSLIGSVGTAGLSSNVSGVELGDDGLKMSVHRKRRKVTEKMEGPGRGEIKMVFWER